jgi:hypothetical protein
MRRRWSLNELWRVAFFQMWYQDMVTLGPTCRVEREITSAVCSREFVEGDFILFSFRS